MGTTCIVLMGEIRNSFKIVMKKKNLRGRDLLRGQVLNTEHPEVRTMKSILYSYERTLLMPHTNAYLDFWMLFASHLHLFVIKVSKCKVIPVLN
jgi:hypothetical protein